jgi:hypothetical protein
MENSKLEYKIITAQDYLMNFERNVNAAITEGWQPCGGICAAIHQGSGTISYYQAMTRVLPPATTADIRLVEVADNVSFTTTTAGEQGRRTRKGAANAN